MSDGFLLEWDLQATPKLALYGRAEIADKQLFGLGFHPAGFQHPHVYSHIDVLTLGAVRDVVIARWARLGLGGDVTLYHMSPDMLPYYEVRDRSTCSCDGVRTIRTLATCTDPRSAEAIALLLGRLKPSRSSSAPTFPH